MNKTPKITKVGLFVTPEDLPSFQNYLSNFNGSEAAVAQTGAWCAWNLAGKIVNPPEGSVSITMTKKEINNILASINIAMKCACDQHKKDLIKLHKELNEAIKD